MLTTLAGELTEVDGAIAVRRETLDLPGYAMSVHCYTKPGDCLVRVERTDNQGIKAVAHLHVRADGDP